jgi:hypothetical protein
MASRMNYWSLVRTFICLEMWLEESSKSELDVVISSIFIGSSKVSEGFVLVSKASIKREWI